MAKKKLMRVSKVALMKVRQKRAEVPAVREQSFGRVVETKLIGRKEQDALVVVQDKHVTQVMKETGEETRTALRMMFWKLQYDTAGDAKRRVPGTEQTIPELLKKLESADMTWDRLTTLTNAARINLFARLSITPTERLHIVAMLRNRPCGAVVLSKDGKHVCMRQRVSKGERCDIPEHGVKYNGGDDDEDGFPDRDEIRRRYGRSVYPVREIYEEADMQKRAEKLYGGVDIEELGHAVEMVELVKDVVEKQRFLGADPETIGGKEDVAVAYDMWSYLFNDDLSEMEERRREREFSPVSDGARVFETTFVRGEFDKGGPGEYKKKVESRKDAWGKWITAAQRILHEAIESHSLYSGTAQSMTPPKISTMQRAVDTLDPYDPAKPPSPMELRSPKGVLSDPLFRPLDPSRAVTEADQLPVMPTIILQSRVSLNTEENTGNIGGSLAMSFKVLIHREACFTQPPALQARIKSRLSNLPVPPAMIPFNLLFRVDPYDLVLQHRRQAEQQLIEGSDVAVGFIDVNSA